MSVYGGGGSGAGGGAGDANIQILKILDLFPAYCLDKEEMARDAQCVREGNCKTLYQESVAVHHYQYAMSCYAYPEVKKHLSLG